MSAFMAFLHHVGAFTLFAAIVVELVLLREELKMHKRSRAGELPQVDRRQAPFFYRATPGDK